VIVSLIFAVLDHAVNSAQIATTHLPDYFLMLYPGGTHYVRFCRASIALSITTMSLARLFTNACAPAQPVLTDLLENREILALFRTCHQIRNGGLFGFVFNTNRFLATFFDSPKAFRELQGQHGIMIIDQSAWSFLARKPDPTLSESGHQGKVLMLAIEAGPNFDALRNFLLQDGYVHQHPITQRLPSRLEGAAICLYWHYTTRKFVLIHTTTYTPLYYILQEPLTCCMCFITWSKAYSLFPNATFILKEAYTTKSVNQMHRSSLTLRAWSPTNITIKPLSLRDHRILPDPHGRRHETHTMMYTDGHVEVLDITNRYVKDSHSWMVPLDINGLPSPASPDYPIDFAGLRTLANFELMARLAIGVELVRSIALHHEYIIATGISHHNQPTVSVLRRSAEQQRYAAIAVEQVYATDANERPQYYQQLVFQMEASIGWCWRTYGHGRGQGGGYIMMTRCWRS
jgi:hypothetical protein